MHFPTEYKMQQQNSISLQSLVITFQSPDIPRMLACQRVIMELNMK